MRTVAEPALCVMEKEWVPDKATVSVVGERKVTFRSETVNKPDTGATATIAMVASGHLKSQIHFLKALPVPPEDHKPLPNTTIVEIPLDYGWLVFQLPHDPAGIVTPSANNPTVDAASCHVQSIRTLAEARFSPNQ